MGIEALTTTDDGRTLAGIRVLDLATERAELAGRLLADLGADVLKIEPPAGARARHVAPFDERPDAPSDGDHPRSLYWAAVGVGKRSLVLDLELPEDREQLMALVGEADVLVESFDPGYLDAHGLGADALREANPKLVYASVTPFGSEGPKAHWPTSELTIEAASGRLSLQGDRDRPPLPFGYPQAAFHAGAQAAADIIIALNERETSGLGQRLDTSMLEVMIWTLMNGSQYPPATGHNPPGGGDDRAVSDFRAPGEGPPVPCADGYVNLVMPPPVLGQFLAAVHAELGDDLDVPSEVLQLSPAEWAERAMTGLLPPDFEVGALDAVMRFIAGREKRELFRWATAHRLRLAPIYSTADVLEEPQFQARGYWCDVGDVTHPGAFARLSRTPLLPPRAAPTLDDARGSEAWHGARHPLPAPSAEADRSGEAFEGLKVADFTWVGAGPMTAKALGDHGATVVRVESATRLDVIRRLPPFPGDVIDFDQSWWMANVNGSKRGVALNLGTEEGLALARQLIDWSDVVLESFTPGVMQRFGLDYETVSADHPELIMLSACLLGQTGPQASYGGFGSHGAAISGFQRLTSWPDRPPTGPSGPYTDVITPRFAVPALTAAIFERRRSGLGQHIDLSQVEAALRFLEPLLLDQAVNGRTAPPAGHSSRNAAPHGVYATSGLERYIAIAVETAEQWRALRAIAPLEEFADPRFDALEARLASAEAIEATIRDWTRDLDGRELEAELVAVGVPVSVVQRMTELHEDPQLAARGFFQVMPHSASGFVTHDGHATHFSAKREMLHSSAPLLGEHTEYVLREFLGIDDASIAEYAAAGALT